MKRHEAFQAEKPMVTGFQKHSERKKTQEHQQVTSQGEWGAHTVASSVLFQKNTCYINRGKTSHTLQGFDKNPH